MFQDTRQMQPSRPVLETGTVFEGVLNNDGNVVCGEHSISSHGEVYPSFYDKEAADRVTLLREYVTSRIEPIPLPTNIVQAAAGTKR